MNFVWKIQPILEDFFNFLMDVTRYLKTLWKTPKRSNRKRPSKISWKVDRYFEIRNKTSHLCEKFLCVFWGGRLRNNYTSEKMSKISYLKIGGCVKCIQIPLIALQCAYQIFFVFTKLTKQPFLILSYLSAITTTFPHSGCDFLAHTLEWRGSL